MEQLIATFGLDWRLLITQMINFGIVLFVLWYFLYRPVMDMIDKRQEKMQTGVKDAEKARLELETANEEKGKILTDANANAERLVSEGKTFAETQKAEILQEAQEKSEKALKEAQVKGEEAKRQLLRESKEEIARMVVLGAEQVLRERVPENGASKKQA